MKITGFLLLFFVISLAVVTGCDENNNMLSQPPGLGEPPPPSSSKCEGVDLDQCPCDYDVIPKTMECWTLEGTMESSVVYDATASSCKLAAFVDGADSTPYMTIRTDGFCGIELQILDVPSCTESSNLHVVHEDLTSDETTACQCRLEQYTKELIQAGIGVTNESSADLAAEEISCPVE